MASAAFDYLVFPLLLPFICLWLLAARALSLVVPIFWPLTAMLARRLEWAVPFIPSIYAQRGRVLGGLIRFGFEFTYAMNVVRRYLTLPLCRSAPDFFIVGFPKAGTTSLAAYLKQHPAIDGIDGLRWHESMHKESHHFMGALGRHAASSATAYRSYFPTCLKRWWVERVRRAGKWLVFDACPVNACLDYTAARMAKVAPDAKLIFCLRDPVAGAFSAEIMLRNLGVPLSWSLMEDVRPADPRFAETPADVAYWEQVAKLDPDAPLPEDLMQKFYFDAYSVLRCGRLADRIAPFLEHYKPENIMFIEFSEFTSNTHAVVQRALEFVGADPQKLRFKELPPGMQGERRGRRMHPSVKRKLAAYFAEPNLRLFALLGRSFPWTDPLSQAAGPSAYASFSTVSFGSMDMAQLPALPVSTLASSASGPVGGNKAAGSNGKGQAAGTAEPAVAITIPEGGGAAAAKESSSGSSESVSLTAAAAVGGAGLATAV